ncbi:MAG: M23 family metallopeptidase [Anaerolineae bacterium]|nr:M23 family metallopeptidase [Anaerolineae bacterium]
MVQQPLWSQPWQFTDPDLWQYQEITLTGAAAEIDQESIRLERERLFAIWEQSSPQPQWTTSFQLPITDYLAISSPFGARRSYNGGPYSTYHEGVDFAAYGGTAVYAPAAGTVVVAEQLYVRGGAVILDHGLGIYSGFYHMSEILVTPGEVVQMGQPIGRSGHQWPFYRQSFALGFAGQWGLGGCPGLAGAGYGLLDSHV